ncbi:hypothetical protein D3C74_360280 [compost metagenome]
MRGGEQVVAVLAVREAEQVGPVLLPPARGLVGLARQQGREVDLLAARVLHLLADDRLDLGEHAQAQREPGVDAGGGTTDVAGAHEELVARDLGVDRVLAQRPQEQGGHLEGLDGGTDHPAGG